MAQFTDSLTMSEPILEQDSTAEFPIAAATQSTTALVTSGATPVVSGELPEPSPTPTAGPEAAAAPGVGIDGEQTVWVGQYSLKNFLGRILVRLGLTLAWVGVVAYAAYAYNFPATNPAWVLLWVVNAVLALAWLSLGWRMILARAGHHYQLTNRRLFIASGVFRRRRDQVELLRIDDMYIKQTSFLQRMLNVGTVVVESSEPRMPISYVLGVDSPQNVMDQIWHYARAERDVRSLRVDQV